LTGHRNPLNLKELWNHVNLTRGPGAAFRFFRLEEVIHSLVRAALAAVLVGVAVAPLEAQNDHGLGRLVVRGLTFEGNRAIDDYLLSISIATTKSTSFWQTSPLVRWIGLGEHRLFDEREFRRDVLRLRLLYNQHGYLEAQIDTVVHRSNGNVSVRFLIYEGEPVRIRALTVSGVERILSGDDLRDLPLATGDSFNRLLLQAAADSLSVWLKNRGYPFVEVFQSFDMDREARQAVVAFDVDPGRPARIAEVNVVGAEEIGEGIVRRMIPLRAGNVYRLEDLYAAQRDLYNSRIFDYVSVMLEDSLPDGPNDSLVTVRVAVTQGDLHRIRAGVGFGSIDCFRGLLGWTAGNFLGGGRTFDLTGRVSKIGSGDPFPWGFQDNVCFGLVDEEDEDRLAINYNVTASLREPRLLTRPLSGVLSVFAEKRSELSAYLREVVGGEMAVTWASPWNIPLTVSYSAQYGGTDADPATFCAFLNVCRVEDTRRFVERVFESTAGVSLVRERSNSTLDPTRGNRISAELRWASSAIGSDELARYTRAVGQLASYHRIGRKSVLAWRVRVGAIFPPRLSLQGQSVEFVPPAERFYGGGPNSVRGFGQNELGPVVRVLEESDGDIVVVEDANGVRTTLTDRRFRTASPTGGNQLYFANVELRGPLPGLSGRLSGALFVDVGQVFVRRDSLASPRITPGLGLRVTSPLGPVRLDVAYNPHDPQVGQLFELVVTRDAEGKIIERRLDPVGDALRPVRGRGLFNRLQLHFSVGQAF